MKKIFSGIHLTGKLATVFNLKDVPRKCLFGYSNSTRFKSYLSFVMSGRNADLAVSWLSEGGSSAPPPAPPQAVTGSGGTRAQKWPRV